MRHKSFVKIQFYSWIWFKCESLGEKERKLIFCHQSRWCHSRWRQTSAFPQRRRGRLCQRPEKGKQNEQNFLKMVHKITAAYSWFSKHSDFLFLAVVLYFPSAEAFTLHPQRLQSRAHLLKNMIWNYRHDSNRVSSFQGERGNLSNRFLSKARVSKSRSGKIFLPFVIHYYAIKSQF